MTASQKAEALNKSVTFKYKDEEFEVAADALDDLELLEHVEDEKFLAATRGFVGEDGYKRFKELARNESNRVPLAEFETFLNTLFEAMNSKN